MAKSPKTVMGVHAPAPRITARAIWLALVYLGFPLFLALVAFDVVVWLAAQALWDICIGLWCWF